MTTTLDTRRAALRGYLTSDAKRYPDMPAVLDVDVEDASAQEAALDALAHWLESHRPPGEIARFAEYDAYERAQRWLCRERHGRCSCDTCVVDGAVDSWMDRETARVYG